MAEKKRGSRGAARRRSPTTDDRGPGTSPPAGESKPLPEHLEAVREWIAAGGHNRPEVAEAVARRILERGEMRDDRDENPPRPFGRRDSLIH